MDVTAEQPALAGLAPRRRARRAPEARAAELPVAQVVVDRPVPHLGVFDYAVPASMATGAMPGARVKVRLAGQDVDGFCVGRVAGSDHDLVPLRRVVSGEVVLSPAVLELCRAVAARWVGTLADVLRLAVPPRHARTEAAPWPDVVPASGGPTAGSSEGGRAASGTTAEAASAWQPYVGGTAFLRRLAAGEAPRAVWQALPGRDAPWAVAVAEAVGVAVAAGRGALVVVPTAAQVEEVTAALSGAVPPWEPGRPGWVALTADDGPAARYRAFLAVARGQARVVVGTRAAAFAPVADLGLAVCWDDASDLHAEPRAPYPHVRDVLALRSELEGCALLVGGHTRSVAAQRWVAQEWARPLVAPRDVVRAHAPRVVALTSVELAREGPAAGARLPGPAWRVARDALARGPVLVQVPRAGYLPAVACDACRESARCGACAGPLEVGAAAAAPACRWCGRLVVDWRCAECGGTRLRSVRVGSDRTAEELGRAFPGVPVRVSGAASGVIATVPDRPALVVATFGAEPVADGGYAAALLLDAAVATSRPTLDVAEQALRSWTTAAALVRPASQGGTVHLVGDGDPVPTQALVRWDPAWFAERELAERAQLALPPAVHVVALDGPRDAVAGLLGRAGLPDASDVVGPTPLARAEDDVAEDVLLTPDGERQVRALVRTPWEHARVVTERLGAAVAARSVRREPPVRVRTEPSEVW